MISPLSLLATVTISIVVIVIVQGQEPIVFEPVPISLQLSALSRKFQTSDTQWNNLHKANEGFLVDHCQGATLIHRGYGKCQGKLDIHVIPHAAISHDGKQCGGAGDMFEYMTLVPAEKIRNAEVAVGNNLLRLYGILKGNSRAWNAFNVLNNLDPITVGFEYTSPRMCGGTEILKQNSILLFINPTRGTNDLNFGFAYLGSGETGLITVTPDDKMCMYKGTRRRGPGQPPYFTPTPSPTPTDYLISSSVFDILQNAPGLPVCFPVVAMDVSIPSPSPSGSVSVTPGLSPSASMSVPPIVTLISSPSSTPSVTSSAGISPSSSQVSLSVAPVVDSSASPSSSRSREAGVTPSPVLQSPSASSTPDEESTGERACFPGIGRVHLPDGHEKMMRNIQVGDIVQTGRDEYAGVILLTHNAYDKMGEFVRLETRCGHTVHVSEGHYVPIGERLIVAGNIQVGDLLHLRNGSVSQVRRIGRVVLRGVHNPQTENGWIVVDGVVMSTFTRAIKPAMGMALLVPVKAAFRVGVRWMGRLLSRWLRLGLDEWSFRWYFCIVRSGDAVMVQ